MSGFDAQAFQEAKVMDNNDNPPPEPDTYYATVEEATVFTSNAGDDFIRMGYRIRGGAEDGYTWSMLGGSFGSEGAIGAAKSHCVKLGIDVSTINGLEDLDTALRERVGRSFEIKVVQNGEFRNVYVQRDVTDEVPASDVPADTTGLEPAAAGVDDDIPF